MSEYDNTNTGALFRNPKKGENEKAPDYRGTLNVGGTEFWIGSWLRIAKSGEKYMSLAVQAKDEQPQKKAPSRVPGSDDEDSSIPF